MILQVVKLLISSMILDHSVAITQDSQNSPIWPQIEDSWTHWWSYSAFSGPTFWGLNSDWIMCDKGRRQSPIDIQTSAIVHDPHLDSLRADSNLVSGLLYNDGHSIIFNTSMMFSFTIQSQTFGEAQTDMNQKQVNDTGENISSAVTSSKSQSEGVMSLVHNKDTSSLILSSEIARGRPVKFNDSSLNKMQDGQLLALPEIVDTQASVDLALDQPERGLASIPGGDELESDMDDFYFSGAGLIYTYKFEALYFRFDLKSESGSEHRINSRAFPAEVQILAYNSNLFKSFHEASLKPFGILAISILVDLLPSESSKTRRPTHTINRPLASLLNKLDKVRHRGNSVPISGFNLSALLPDTDYFVTYDGSLTMPGCHESVVWLLLNKPTYISQADLYNLRSLSADEPSVPSSGKLIAGNIRPIQPLNGRPVRTNIKPSSDKETSENCVKNWKYEYRLK